MQPEAIKSLCAQSLPITQILPDDTVQSILSFVRHQSNVKLVSKKFNDLSAKKSEAVTRKDIKDWSAIINSKIDENNRLANEREILSTEFGKLIKMGHHDILRVWCDLEKSDPMFRFCRKCRNPRKTCYQDIATGKNSFPACMACHESGDSKCKCKLLKCTECKRGKIYCPFCGRDDGVRKRKCGTKICSDCLQHHWEDCICDPFGYQRDPWGEGFSLSD